MMVMKNMNLSVKVLDHRIISEVSVSHRVWKVIIYLIYLFQYCYLETPPQKSLDFYMNTMSDATYHLSQNIKIVPEI